VSDTVNGGLLGAALLASPGAALVSRKKRSQTGRHRVTVDLGESLDRQLFRAAKRLDLKPSEIVRSAVADFLKPVRPAIAERALITFQTSTRELLAAFRICRGSIPEGTAKEQFQDALDDLLEAIDRVMDLRQ
jgi:predicted transcriptional regulator